MFDLHPAFSINPVPSRVGDKVKIKYHGLLASSGADQIWLHTGYGASSWQDEYDYHMNRASEGFEQTVDINREGQFNFCFKDGANSWDNNNNLNWSYQIRR
ncbi:MAG: carbohydrate-binding protein [Thermacetogeniaceae bacterium]